jgi:hypothetical protein
MTLYLSWEQIAIRIALAVGSVMCGHFWWNGRVGFSFLAYTISKMLQAEGQSKSNHQTIIPRHTRFERRAQKCAN